MSREGIVQRGLLGQHTGWLLHTPLDLSLLVEPSPPASFRLETLKLLPVHASKNQRQPAPNTHQY